MADWKGHHEEKNKYNELKMTGHMIFVHEMLFLKNKNKTNMRQYFHESVYYLLIGGN